MTNMELDILSRIDRIILGADDRGLDDTEIRTLKDARCEIIRLRKSLGARAMEELARMDEELGL